MTTRRVHIRSAVNAAAVSKAGGLYTIRDVCGAVDEIVMNGVLYPGAELAAGAPTLEDKPAPAGHPKVNGRFVSASSGDAMLTCYIGAVCKNARHVGGRTLVDVVVNEAQAKAMPDGAKLVERLEAALTGANADPIHVSTGLYFEAVAENGESKGKRYTVKATKPRYDHLAILLNERGAGTPDDGVGMWLNAEGAEQPVESVALNVEAEDKRSAGLMRWVQRLLGNSGSADMSFSEIERGLASTLPEGSWLQEVFDRYAVFCDRDGRCFRQDYSVASDGSVAWSGTAQEVRRKVVYEAVNRATRQEQDPVKDLILAALNRAGIKTEGLDESALLAAYNALAVKPVQEQLDAANATLQANAAAQRAAEQAEVDALATELAANSLLKADDLKALPLARLREIKANRGTTAAPVLPGLAGNAGTGADPYATYPDNPGFDPKEGK